jgi:hypothetical protein
MIFARILFVISIAGFSFLAGTAGYTRWSRAHECHALAQMVEHYDALTNRVLARMEQEDSIDDATLAEVAHAWGHVLTLSKQCLGQPTPEEETDL